MKKTEKKKAKKTATASAHRIVGVSGTIDWTPLVGIAKAALHWTHHLAAELSRPEERASIERVFRGLPLLLDGGPDEVELEDALQAFRVIGRGIERAQRVTPGTFDMLASVLAFALGPIAGVSPVHAMPTPIAPPRPRAPSSPSRALADLCALVFPLGTSPRDRNATLHIHR